MAAKVGRRRDAPTQVVQAKVGGIFLTGVGSRPLSLRLARWPGARMASSRPPEGRTAAAAAPTTPLAPGKGAPMVEEVRQCGEWCEMALVARLSRPRGQPLHVLQRVLYAATDPKRCAFDFNGCTSKIWGRWPVLRVWEGVLCGFSLCATTSPAVAALFVGFHAVAWEFRRNLPCHRLHIEIQLRAPKVCVENAAVAP